MINQPELMLRKSAPGRSSGYEKDINLLLVIFLQKMLLNTKYLKRHHQFFSLKKFAKHIVASFIAFWSK